MTRTKAKKKSHKGLWITLTVLVILFAAVLSGALWYSNALKPAGSSQEEVGIEISEGESLDSLLTQLKEKGLIRSDMAAKIYATLHKSDRYAGTFELNSSMSTPEILRYVSDPANIKATSVSVTIPEGKWARDIASILGNALPNLSANEFLRLWNDNAYIETLAQSYPFIDPAALENDQYFVKLEGYLFPDTYFIDLDMNEDQVTRMILDQFGNIYNKYAQAIADSGYSLQQILTLASIIQFESGDVAEMKDISGVLHNRLAQSMPLQSSVTVCYALYDDFNTSEQCETNTDIDSPYNTYLHNGLPIGPILNPGEDAIEAALYPNQNEYLYFVSDIYGDGKTYFASTYEEHLANIERFNLQLDQGQ